MMELTQKKFGKLIGLKKSDFNDLIKSKQIILQKPRLRTTYGKRDLTPLIVIADFYKCQDSIDGENTKK